MEGVEEKKEGLKCTECKSKVFCRRRNISKGSSVCDQERGLLPRKSRKDPSAMAQSMGLLGYLMRKKEQE